MIPLLDQQPFAVGGRRECYVHPDDNALCIKIHRPEFAPALLYRQSPWWRNLRKKEIHFDENYSDWKVLNDLEKKSEPRIWDHLPKLNGWAETDRGRGLVIELIRDADGLISRTLLDWVWRNGPGENLNAAIDAFSIHWMAHNIPSRSLGLHNIVMQDQGENGFRLVLIDGLGSTQWLPLSKWSSRYGRARSESKIARLRKEIEELLERRKNSLDPGTRGFLLSRD